jgi:poly-gamma-glutamate synthesis protein (capsule biosynthesis protein)
MRKRTQRPLTFIGFVFICSLFTCLPGEPAPPTFTFAFVGDVMLGRGVARSLDGHWEDAFKEVRPWLAEADLTFANLESPLTTAPRVSDGYDLRAPPQAVVALDAAGLDVVSLANNHALDAGEVGLAETVATLDAVGITSVTGWETDNLSTSRFCHSERSEESIPCRTETLRCAQGDKSRNSPSMTSHRAPCPSIRYQLLAFDDATTPLDLETSVSRVTSAAKQADLVIVSVHWGGEYQAAPSPRQQSIAQALARAGAGLIIGHGPHVLQRVEWIGETLIAYSLGNFLFDQPYPADCRRGAILRVTWFAHGSRPAVQVLPTVVEHGRVKPASPIESPAILDRLALEHRTKQ